ncbi:MAG: permease [Flavobacteriales bacterium]
MRREDRSAVSCPYAVCKLHNPTFWEDDLSPYIRNVIEMIKQLGLTLGGMAWQIFWVLSLGFILSSLIQVFIPTQIITKRLGKNTVCSTGLAALLGAVSSSCSFAAASMGRTLFHKGATLSNSVAFMVASTNLVLEIFFIILALMGWPFVAGELIGGGFFIAVAASGITHLIPKSTVDKARAHTRIESKGEKTEMYSCCGAPATQPNNPKSIGRTSGKKMGSRLNQAAGFFYRDVNMVGKDILIGLGAAAVIAVVVPTSFWNTLFFKSAAPSILVLLWNAAVGIVVAMLSFVCSCGNILLAAALWHGGIHFGGVIAFIFADLLTIPMIRIYKKYYGKKMALYLFLILSVAILLTAIFVDYSFTALDLIPQSTAGGLPIAQSEMGWNCKTVLNILFIPVVWIYYISGRKQLKA